MVLDAGDEVEILHELQLVDMFTPHLVVRASGKIRSFDFGLEPPALKGSTQVCHFWFTHPPKFTYCRLAQLFLALASNALEVYNIPPPSKNKEEPPEAVRSFSVDLPGHRTDIRTLSLSADDQILASASSGRHLSRPFHCLSNTH